MEVEQKALRRLVRRARKPQTILIKYAALREVLEESEAAHSFIADMAVQHSVDNAAQSALAAKKRVTRMLNELDHIVAHSHIKTKGK